MRIVVNSPGTYITKFGECFRLKLEDLKQDYPAKKVEQILITTSTAFSSDAIELAVENNIDIVFLKNTGRPFARVWHSKMGSISTIRRKQLKLQEHPIGVEMTLDFIIQKLDNQIMHLQKLSMNRRDDRRKFANAAVEKLRENIVKLDKLRHYQSVEEIRGTVQGIEGSSSRMYFNIMGRLIPEKYKFNGRSRNPAKDHFNCMLNYGYGVLYSSVEKACIIAGLDPYIGILHTDNYNKKALTFDIIEMYRVHAEEVVMKLFSTRKVKAEHFEEVKGGFYLNKEGKKLFITEYNEKLETKIRYRNRNIEMQNIIQFDCHNIANKILEEIE